MQFLLDGGLLSDYLAQVYTWAVANPTEVLSILIVNSDGVDAATMGAAFKVRRVASHSLSTCRSLSATSF